MTISAISSSTAQASKTPAKTGFAALGAADFISLMTKQMQMQDPLEPTDNKEMLAQMAQFSSLGGINDLNDTLKQISTKLDTIMTAQANARSVTSTATNPTA